MVNVGGRGRRGGSEESADLGLHLRFSNGSFFLPSFCGDVIDAPFHLPPKLFLWFFKFPAYNFFLTNHCGAEALKLNYSIHYAA